MLLVIAMAATVATAEAQAAKAPPGAKRALSVLVKQAKKLPKAAASKRVRARLLADARLAARSARRAPCKSVRSLNRLRLRLGHVRNRNKRAAAKLALLGPASLVASRKLLGDKRTRRCGGGVKPSKLKAPTAKVLESTTKRLRLRVTMPDLRFGSRTGGGRAWTQIVMPNTDSPQKPGQPAIPIVSRTFAVPEGATVLVNTKAKETLTLNGVDLFPAQPDVVDQGPASPAPDFRKPPFVDAPFQLNSAAYASNRPFPADSADGAILGHARDIQLGNVQIPAARYKAATKHLEVIRSLDVIIDFAGKNSGNIDTQVGSPWERMSQRLALSLLNGKLVFDRSKIWFPRRCGEELLIVTNPATRPAADTLRNARSAAGIRSRVVETGAGAGQIGTTAAAIQAYIRTELTNFPCVRPSYVAIMGDDDLVPTFPGINGIPSDLPYSMKNDADELPDLAVGRIIGNDQGEVQTAVGKIVGYEAGPPAGLQTLHAMVAAQFQDDNGDGQEERTFIQFAETVSAGLAGRGVGVTKVYRDSPASTPLRLNDGTPLPASLQKPTFPWTGTGADVTAAWNAGPFLAIHRDHGWSDGWGTPGFGTADVNALTNGAKLPVLMSINCSSAAYDYDETSFVGRALVNPNGGAVGAFGDTRDSPTWHNSQIGLGFVDGLLPSVLPAEGPASAQRVGDALINGKLRLAGLSSPATDGSTRNELYLWHYFGDPTMQMWGGSRRLLDLSQVAVQAAFFQTGPGPGDPPPYHVTVGGLPVELAGQPVSLLRNGTVVGKATIGADGTADIPASLDATTPKPGELRVALEPDGGAPASYPVDSPKVASTLTQTCPTDAQSYNEPWTVSGNLSGPPAGSAVVVTFTAPNTNRVEQHTALTDAGGNWTTTLDPSNPNTEDGTWTVSSHYAGNAQYAPSDAGPCSVQVNSG
ncbi:MAG: hypothetical protein QOF17_1016 [Solirubrobacteraceae bacterium]|nr:hypothetical protein [Solirubrobacteraceae bacterium]